MKTPVFHEMSSSDGQTPTQPTNTSDNSTTRNKDGSTGASTAGRNNGILAFQTSKEVNAFAKKYRTEIAASTSSVLSAYISFPLDFAKSRMQSYNTKFWPTMIDAYKTEGIRTFWRGVFPPLVSITIVRTISFTLYQKSKYTLDHAITQVTGQSPLMLANAPGSYPTWSTIACFGGAGALAGAVITTISSPFELLKLNEQLAGKRDRDSVGLADKSEGSKISESKHTSKGRRPFPSTRLAYNIFMERGIQGLYAGYRLHLLRDTIGTSIYFIAYESTKQLMGNARGKSATSPFAVAVAGAFCGLASWTIVSREFNHHTAHNSRY